MADPSKTEKATPRRKEKAREEGSVLRVPDMDATIMLWGNLFLFTALGGATFALMAQMMGYYLRKTSEVGSITPGNLQALAISLLSVVMRILLPFLVANFLLSLSNQFLQHGFKLNTKALVPKFSKINPASGFKRLFSAKALVDLAKSLIKLTFIVWMAYTVVVPRMPTILTTMKMPLHQSFAYLQETLFILYRNLMLVMIFLAGADYLYQKQAFEKSMRMTKQEIREEAKDSEGNPQIKQKQKSMLFASAMRRIITQVPKASVIITNPTHFAVALRYDEKTAAPVVVAKGADHLALKIRERAKICGVPIVENPPLARAIYRNVDIDKPIPSDLYQAVAQVLAFVYRLRHSA
jgi:flagellar biosynthetic protein FlhB